MLRTALLWGNTITLDADLSKYIETVSDQWVIEGLEVSSNSIAPGKAWVKATRGNGETIMTLVQNTEALAVDTSGTKKIWLEIRQEAIDNGLLNNEDGTWIAEIKTWPTLPSQNFLLLASVAEWVVKDERNLIPKIQSVAQKTSTLEEKLSTAEGQISQLVEAGTPSYLGITGIVWEKYTMEDTLFLQKTPTFTDSAIAINVGDIDKNKEIHIQRIGSWTASNQLKLKMKKFWAPTTSVVVEVRKWVKVDVSDKEAYRYGGEVVATTTIAYTQFTTDWKEFTLTLNNQFWSTKGELLDIVVYQQWGIVNSTNYYQIACDSTQYSEAFSAVAVNGNSRVRNKLMPYCVNEGFVEECLSKKSDEVMNIEWSVPIINEWAKSGDIARYETKVFHTLTGYKKLHISFLWNVSSSEWWFTVRVNGNNYFNWYSSIDNDLVCNPEDVIQFVAYNSGSSTTFSYQYLRIFNKAPILLKKNTELLPRRLVNIGEMVATTLLGLHTDNSWKPYEKKQAIELNLTMNQYKINTQRVAPSDWFLMVNFITGMGDGIRIGDQQFNASINGIILPVFVKKWLVKIRSWSDANIKLLYFIPL